MALHPCHGPDTTEDRQGDKQCPCLLHHSPLSFTFYWNQVHEEEKAIFFGDVVTVCWTQSGYCSWMVVICSCSKPDSLLCRGLVGLCWLTLFGTALLWSPASFFTDRFPCTSPGKGGCPSPRTSAGKGGCPCTSPGKRGCPYPCTFPV